MRDLGIAVIGCVVCFWAAVPSRANGQIKSADGQLEVTTLKDGTIKALNNKYKVEWQFPMQGSDIPKGKNFQTSFAPIQNDLSRLYVAYGSDLYCIEGVTGKYIWKSSLADKMPGNVSFVFRGQDIVVTVDGKERTFEMKNGKEK